MPVRGFIKGGYKIFPYLLHPLLRVINEDVDDEIYLSAAEMLEGGCVGLRLGILLFQIGSVIFGQSDWLRSCLPNPHHPRGAPGGGSTLRSIDEAAMVDDNRWVGWGSRGYNM